MENRRYNRVGDYELISLTFTIIQTYSFAFLQQSKVI